MDNDLLDYSPIVEREPIHWPDDPSVGAGMSRTHDRSNPRAGRLNMDTPNALATLALGGAIAGDVAATFVVERAARQRDRRLWVTGAVVFFASLAMLALALEEIPTAVAQALFIAVGTTAVAVVAIFRGENISTRKVISLALLVLGVVVLQMGAGDG
jgi:small multidrug resistance pump